MGTIGNNIFGHFSGKVGAVVGATWRGIPVLRTAPKESTKPPSPAQLLQRAKFSALMAFLHPIKPFLAARFGKREGNNVPFELALSYHLKEAIEVEGDTLKLIYPKVCISKGHLRGVEGITATVVSGDVLTIQWRDNSDQSFACAGDLLTIALYVPAVASFFFFENIALRKDINAELSLPAAAIGADVHCWATFVTISGSQAATSCYFSYL